MAENRIQPNSPLESPAKHITLAPEISQETLRSPQEREQIDEERRRQDVLHRAQLEARKKYIAAQVADNKSRRLNEISSVAGRDSIDARQGFENENKTDFSEVGNGDADPRVQRLRQLNALRNNVKHSQQKHVPKISTGMAIVVVGWAMLLDFITICCLFLALDDFIVTDLLALPITGYFWWKGSKWVIDLIMKVIEWIPYVGTLPLMTLGALIVVIVDRSPKLNAALSQVSQKVAKGKGGTKMPKTSLPKPATT